MGSINEIEESKLHFNLGKEAALAGEYDVALQEFSKSNQIYNNAESLINCAKILQNRVRHVNAYTDITEAISLIIKNRIPVPDSVQKLESTLKNLSSFYFHSLGAIAQAKIDYDNIEIYAKSLMTSAYSLSEDFFEHGYAIPVKFENYFFNEIKRICQYENIEKYPEVHDFAYGQSRYPSSFIDLKVLNLNPENKLKDYEIILQSYLCCFDIKTMILLRRKILYITHECMMSSDYGGMQYSMDCESYGRIKDANDHIRKNNLDMYFP